MADEWVEQVRKSIQYRREALEFLARAREQFPTSNPNHAATVADLWLAADTMDELVCSALERLNQGLLDGASEVEITRGVSMQPVQQMDPLLDPGFPAVGPDTSLQQETLVYECAWTLMWEDGQRGVAVRLTVDPGKGEFRCLAHGRSYPETRDLPYPVEEERLTGALGRLFAAEVTAQDTERELDALAAEYMEQERALQEAAGIDLENPEDAQ